MDQDPNGQAGVLEDYANYVLQKNWREQTVIFSDYGKGALRERVLDCRSSFPDKKVFLDPKLDNFLMYKKPYLITPNMKEALQMTGRSRIKGREELLKVGNEIMEKTGCKYLLITMGSKGMALFQPDGSIWRIKATARNVFDVTGAGDTVIAVLAQAVTGGASLIEGCILANVAAGQVVGQIGTAGVELEELKRLVQETDLKEAVERWG